MKHILILFSFLAIFSCSNRKEYKAEDFLNAQVDYEKRKKEITAKKGRFFEDRRAKLVGIVEAVDLALDTTREDQNIPADTTFFMGDVEMDPINFGMRIKYGRTVAKDTLPKAGAVFFNKGETRLTRGLFWDPLEELRECFTTNVDVPCLQLKEDQLQSILDLKYAFVVDELLVMAPVLKGSEFDGGIYLAEVVCYDLGKNTPVLSFTVSAGSSEEVKASRIGMSNEDMIRNDFELNIKKAVLSSCKKHFVFSENLNFASYGF